MQRKQCPRRWRVTPNQCFSAAAKRQNSASAAGQTNSLHLAHLKSSVCNMLKQVSHYLWLFIWILQLNTAQQTADKLNRKFLALSSECKCISCVFGHYRKWAFTKTDRKAAQSPQRKTCWFVLLVSCVGQTYLCHQHKMEVLKNNTCSRGSSCQWDPSQTDGTQTLFICPD